MKRLLAFILSLIMIIGLFACAGEKTNEENPPSNPQDNSTPTDNNDTPTDNNDTPTDNNDTPDEYPENLAKIVIDYEEGIKDGLEIMRAQHPEYEYFYNPVKAVECIYIINSDESPSEILAKHEMTTLFETARVEAYDAVKMIGIYFERDDFTEDMHQNLKRIKEEEPLITNLLVDMKQDYVGSYAPKIDTDSAVKIGYETVPHAIKVDFNNSYIIKSKAEYDAFDKRLDSQNDLYDEAFFEENALVITRIITRGSGSIELSVDNLYVAEGKLYVAIRTDEPAIGDDAIQHKTFTIEVKQSDVADVNEVIVLE